MPKKKADQPEVPVNILKDTLEFLEYSAAKEGWFEDYSRGWTTINKLRIALKMPVITPIDEPTGDYFASDGAQK